MKKMTTTPMTTSPTTMPRRDFDVSGLSIGDVVERYCAMCNNLHPYTVFFVDGDMRIGSPDECRKAGGAYTQHLDRDYAPAEKPAEA